MHRLGRYVAVLVPLLLASALSAQQATVSRYLGRALRIDTTVTVWLFARNQVSVPQLVSVVDQLGGRVRRRSEWLHAVSAEISSAALRSAQGRPEIRHIQPVARFVGQRPEGSVPLAAPPILP